MNALACSYVEKIKENSPLFEHGGGGGGGSGGYCVLEDGSAPRWSKSPA